MDRTKRYGRTNYTRTRVINGVRHTYTIKVSHIAGLRGKAATLAYHRRISNEFFQQKRSAS